MGCSISCSLFETFSSLFEWVVRDVSGILSVIHSQDDFFLCIGPADSNRCRILLATVQHMADRFGIPSAKTEGPLRCLVCSAF